MNFAKKIPSFRSLLSIEVFSLIVIILMAAFFRLSNLPNTLTFQADQARDAILVSKIFLEHKPVFIGPVTSVGNMYLGPLYYYFMLPFLVLSYPSPLGPAYGVALCGILAVFLFYKLGSQFLGKTAGMISAILAAMSATLIYFSRFSWNPNPVPLVSLLMIYFTYLAWKKNSQYWLAVAICFSVLLQLHYLSMIMLAGAGFFWLWSLLTILKKKKQFQLNTELISFAKITLLCLVIGLVFFSPLVLFDIKHDFVNLRAFQSIFVSEKILTAGAAGQSTNLLLGIVRESHGRTVEVLYTLLFGKLDAYQNYLLLGVGLYLLAFFKFRRKIADWDGQFLVLIYLVLSIIGISAYKRSIFDHYLLFIMPMSLWFWGSALANLWKMRFGKVLVVAFIGCFAWYNLQHLPLKSSGWTISKVKGITDEVVPQLHTGEKYDVVLLSDSGDFYGMNYRYFLNTSAIPPIDFESAEPVNTLVIINENQKNKVVEEIPVYQIKVFGKPKKIIKIPNTDGPNLEIWRK